MSEVERRPRGLIAGATAGLVGLAMLRRPGRGRSAGSHVSGGRHRPRQHPVLGMGLGLQVGRHLVCNRRGLARTSQGARQFCRPATEPQAFRRGSGSQKAWRARWPRDSSADQVPGWLDACMRGRRRRRLPVRLPSVGPARGNRGAAQSDHRRSAVHTRLLRAVRAGESLEDFMRAFESDTHRSRVEPAPDHRSAGSRFVS